MKGTFKLICAAVAAIIMIVPLAAFGEEIQIGSMAHTNADGAIGCGGGGQGSVKITDGDSDKDGQPTGSESGENSGGGGGASSGRYLVSSLEQATEFFNVQDYTIEDSEKYSMHDFDTAMRRDNAIGEAWAIFEIPYISKFEATSLHLPEDVAPMKFELSKDGEKWTAADVEVTEEPTDGRWTEVRYSASQIRGVRYVKIIWGEEENLQNWWNPYFIALTAQAANPYDAEIVIDTDENICIPMYDSQEYCLSGRVLDQIGLERENEIIWFNVSQNPDEISVSKDGKFTISSDMTDGTTFTIQAYCSGLSTEKTFTLCAALPGDTDGDNIITQADIDFILENYGKAANAENRLCDVDKDGKIDIVDLCYAARYVNVDFNKRPSDAEKDPDNAEDKSEDSDDSNKSGSGDLSGSADGDADSANARR